MNLLLYFLISLIISEILPKILINKTLNNSLDSQKDNYKKIKNQTPILGGFIFIIPICIYLIISKNLKLLLWLTPSLVFGTYDDYIKIKNKATSKGLGKEIKSIFLIVNYLFFSYVYNSKITLIKLINYLLIYTGVLVTDGIDGLLGSLSLDIILTSRKFDKLSQIISIGLLHFLNKNKNPAKIFMGDTGSSFLAALLYYVIFESKKYYLGIIFMVGSISSSLQILTKKLIDKKILNFSPFHHNLETLGWNENQIVIFYNLIYYLIFVYFKINNL